MVDVAVNIFSKVSVTWYWVTFTVKPTLNLELAVTMAFPRANQPVYCLLLGLCWIVSLFSSVSP